jgi:small subunit ribosomal protein S4
MARHRVNQDEYKIMKIGSKYKIARRLGVPIFEKTQTPKFILSLQKKKQGSRPNTRPKTGFAYQVIEKQKLRFTYFISSKQLVNYVKSAILKNPLNTGQELYSSLEKRLDSLVLRAGFSKTRFSARQAVSHGHFMVNGTRVNVPSYRIKESDIISIRESSLQKGLFVELDQNLAEHNAPVWIVVDKSKKTIKLQGEPVYSQQESNFDINSVIQFYKR